jgi:protein farnesyltransferase/geranylgeranyltransferase type-1 subunit alpha
VRRLNQTGEIMSTRSSERSASEASSSPSSSSSTSASASAHSLSSIDGECLYQLACVETFLPLAKDVSAEDEPTASLHPVVNIDYSPNFKFIYGLYRALRGHVEYVDAVARRCRGDHTCQIIRALRTSPARWLLLLGFALRQCTSNYTVWKDRRDVIMSPEVLRHATRDQLPALDLPEIALSSKEEDTAKKEKALTELKESQKKIQLVAQHWLPGNADLLWDPVDDSWAAPGTCAAHSTTLSPWRAVHWELNAIGCFTRLYHKNFQVWHHRKELLSYALQHTTATPPARHADPSAEGEEPTTAATAAAEDNGTLLLLESEDTFTRYLQQHHGLRFADVDERETVKTVLCDTDSKNYHAWLHLSWYLHAMPFLLKPPSWATLKVFAKTVRSTPFYSADGTPAAQQTPEFRVHPEWAHVAPFTDSSTAETQPASRHPTLPPSPLTTEMDFTAQLIQQDCLNNSAWCHRYSLFKEDLMRRLWQQQVLSCSDDNCNRTSASSNGLEFKEVVYALCMVEADFALQWLHVDPTNESAYTHARSIAVLYHTIMVRDSLLRAADADTLKSDRTNGEEARCVLEGGVFLRYLRDAPLCPPVAAASLDLCTNAEDGSVSPAVPAHEMLLHRMQHPRFAWSDYNNSFAVLRHVQRVLHTSIRQRVAELERQVAHVLRAAVSAGPSSSDAAGHKVMVLKTLYERSSQYMLDNFHQVLTAQYLACQAMLEEMWVLYLSDAQRRAVRQARPPEAYREGIKPEWVSCLPWENEAITQSAKRVDEVVVCFLDYEAAALELAKRLTVQDPIRYKYWKHEAMNTMQRGYGTAL